MTLYRRERSVSPFLKRSKSPSKPKQQLRFFGDSDLESTESVSKNRTAQRYYYSTILRECFTINFYFAGTVSLLQN